MSHCRRRWWRRARGCRGSRPARSRAPRRPAPRGPLRRAPGTKWSREYCAGARGGLSWLRELKGRAKEICALCGRGWAAGGKSPPPSPFACLGPCCPTPPWSIAQREWILDVLSGSARGGRWVRGASTRQEPEVRGATSRLRSRCHHRRAQGFFGVSWDHAALLVGREKRK